MLTHSSKSLLSLLLVFSLTFGLVGCDSAGSQLKSTDEPTDSDPSQSIDATSFFEATNTLESRMQTMGKSVTMSPFGDSSPAVATASKSATSISLTSIAQIDPPGDTTRASHLTYNSGTVYAGYKALGNPFKGGIDILDATDPTNVMDVNSLGSDGLDVQEVAYDEDEDALYVAAAADPSTVVGGNSSLLTKVTNFNNPNTESISLTGKVGKSVVIAPDADQEHDVYTITDEETLYRYDASLGNEVTEERQGVEFRSLATVSDGIFTVDRGARVYSSSVQSPGGLTAETSIGSGVGDLAIGRLHARDEPVLNGERLFLALGSEGIAVLDASNGDLLFREDGSYYTSLTLHEDDSSVQNAPTDLVYAARPNGIIDVYQVGSNGVDTGDPSTGLDEVGTFDLSELDGVDFGTSPQVNQVMGVGCNVYIANSNEGVVALEIDGIQGCGGNEGNQAPTATDDSDDTNEGQSTTTDVLANDSDPDGSLDPSTVAVQSGPSDGTITNVDGSSGEVTYEPDAGFTGDDTYTYTVKDGDGAESNEATVTITVSAGNQPPTASDDSDQTTEVTPTTTDVLANDSDPDGSLDPSTVTVQSGPSDGTITNVDGSTGEITYTPDPGFIGDDTYTYTVEDGDGAASNAATVSITVNRCSNPDPNNDLSGSISGSTGTVNNNSSDCSYDIGLAVYKKFDNNIPPGQNITQVLNDSDTDRIAPNSSATLDVDPPTCDYQIDLFYGEVIQSFGPGDEYGNRKLDFAQVDNGGLCGPKAVDDNGTTDQGNAITIDVASNDTDGDGNLDPTSVSVTSGPSDGTVSNNGDGTITYTPDSGFSGTDTFVYDICDDDNRCASLIGEEGTVTITVNSSNQSPTASDDSDQTTEGQSTTTDVLANDSDPDGSLDVSTVTVQSAPSNGTITNVDGSTGEVTYEPDPGFTGDDTYTYTVKDGAGAESNEATVTVTVNTPNAPSPPVNNPKSISFAAFCTTQGTFNSDDVTIVDVLNKNSNPNEPVSIAWTSTTSLSTVVLKSGPHITNHSGGTSGGAASGGGTSAGSDQSPSSPCPDGETLIIKDEDVGDNSGADS